MKFEKGKPPPPNSGRPKGSPNKTTIEVREAIAQIAQQNVGAVHKWLAEIDDPAKRLDLYLRLLEYHVPKLARTEVSGMDGQPLEIRVVKFGHNPE